MTTSNRETPSLNSDVLMRQDLMSFIHRCFVELNPTQALSQAPHLQIMAAKLTDCLIGQGPKRLIISLPPRSLKSITVSVAAVAWLLGQDPAKQVICASYGQDLADKHARDARTIMMSSFYKRLFPRTRLSTQKLSVSDFMTTEQGFRMATSVGGVVTGRGGNVLIIDDPLKPEDALSEPRRKAVNDWYDSTLLSRLNSKQDGVIIIVMQRLHQDDLVGHVLDRGEEWEVLAFPAIAEVDECYSANTVVGRLTYTRKAGEVLDPGRESLQTLLATKQLIGSYTFASQYQQNPTSREGGIVKRDWLRFYEPVAIPTDFEWILQSWDTACKIGEANDYSVCTTWKLVGDEFYLVDVLRERLTYPQLKKAAIDQFAKHAPWTVVIEDQASGTALIQEIQREGVYCIAPYRPAPGSDKATRFAAQSIKFEARKVFLPTHAPWLEDYVREITGFPGTKYDDQVDSTSQALERLAPMALPRAPFFGLRYVDTSRYPRETC